MKLIIREYIASLRERGELDAVLPDLLTELGFTVYSRPMIGVRQFGVDVAAVGDGEDGIRRVHLFSVKSGNLTRSDWDGGSVQSLRPSLNEIRDHYIATRIPPEYSKLPVAICLCFGGDISESVRDEVMGYIKQNQTSQVSYEEWNGDRLAEAILKGVFRESVLPNELRRHLRKSIAMVEEPDVAFLHFSRLIDCILSGVGVKPAVLLLRARLVNICLWMLFAWAREAGNVEAPYRASEYIVLRVWHLLRNLIGKRSKSAYIAGSLFGGLVELQFSIWSELYEKKILPHARTRHAISTMVGSHSAVDINLKLFESLGRIALRGLWLVWDASKTNPLPNILDDDDEVSTAIDSIASNLVSMVSNNRVLLSPIKDDQVIDIALAITLLATRRKFHNAIKNWLDALASNCAFAYRTHGPYPTSHRSYWDLVEHPVERTEEYRREATQGSVLYPTIALWATVLKADNAHQTISQFKDEELDHCSFQFWVPSEDSVEKLYIDGDTHGASFNDIPVKASSRETLDLVEAECSASPYFDELSAIKLGHWPVLLTACRHYRLPLPPHLWRNLFASIEVLRANDSEANETHSIDRPHYSQISQDLYRKFLMTTSSRAVIYAGLDDLIG